MLLVEGNKISFQYEKQEENLLDEISFFINTKSKIGLIGENGAGKSTLFKIILEKIDGYNGVINRYGKVEVGYLAQELLFDKGIKAIDVLWSARHSLSEIKFKLNSLDMCDERNIFLYSDYEELGGYEFELEIKKIVDKFRFTKDMLDQEVSLLSGGEKTKIALAKVLLSGADLILFDEPTNHLDLATLKWLENYLADVKVPFVIISHDRDFLDKCTMEVWEMNSGKLRLFSGNYSFYKKQMEEEYESMLLKYEVQQKKIRQLENAAKERRTWAFTHQPQTGKNGYAPVYESITNFSKHAMKKAKNVEKRVEMILEKEKAEKPKLELKKKLAFGIDKVSRSKILLEVNSLSKSYSNNLFSALNLVIKSGARMAIVGNNGSGKTTLLKIILGLEYPCLGSVTFSPSASVAYYAQGYENLNFNKGILEEVIGHDMSKQSIARTILGCLGIKKDKVYQIINTLSVGERSKVSLAKAVLSGANFLILDEPTNHLEISSREAIEDALVEFSGTILFVSHDRRFVRKVASEVFDLDSKMMLDNV